MRRKWAVFGVLVAWILTIQGVACPETFQGQTGAAAQAGAANTADDPVRMLVGRLDLEKYKATIKGLTQFGDRRQGTDRNRAANDWIEAQLKSYGCSDVGRIQYQYAPAVRTAGTGGGGAATGGRPGCCGSRSWRRQG